MWHVWVNGKVPRGLDMGCHVAPIYWSLVFLGKSCFGVHQVQIVDLHGRKTLRVGLATNPPTRWFLLLHGFIYINVSLYVKWAENPRRTSMRRCNMTLTLQICYVLACGWSVSLAFHHGTTRCDPAHCMLCWR
jgi:hypothetical protein